MLFRYVSMFFIFVFSRGQFLEERFLKERLFCVFVRILLSLLT